MQRARQAQTQAHNARCLLSGAGEAADGVSGGDPVAFALGMTGCNKRERGSDVQQAGCKIQQPRHCWPCMVDAQHCCRALTSAAPAALAARAFAPAQLRFSSWQPALISAGKLGT